ncbi:SusC/RagA family TonB-linked outer membrane protein [Kriegella aquimaris]|uniref:TonB-linked outer membrane protein, SusC/RagA family n=1 Tax=Kriegella aquimaris TaxID=192904 RepID=A0A1G9LEQ2_9FLAO|nr:TonB-dependent receptor [Kriegella aquimaris]SDL60346.1 TonB-linked outer membrane protein, SusC/RagA family [Kriegella aquimaris]
MKNQLSFSRSCEDSLNYPHYEPLKFITLAMLLISTALHANTTEAFRLTTSEHVSNIDGTVQQEISGTVTDDSGVPLPGASVVEKGTTNGTQTDFDGNYTLAVENANAILEFSYIGYAAQEVAVNGQSNIDAQLVASQAELDEVVVVGYGTQKKSNVSGSIVSVKAEELAKVQSPTFDAALQGKVPGVYISSNGGQPGGGIAVRIRGVGSINNSNPLYVIDGVVVPSGNSENSNPLVSINPNDIETIDILKDAASTAIYGARAANGVVLITTKRGQVGKPKVTYNVYGGFQKPIGNLPPPMNAEQFAENMNLAFTAAGEDAPFTDPAALGKGADYLGAVVNTGWITDHQLAVSGGSENHRYYTSLNYFDNEGIMLETFQKRFSVRVNTDNTITKGIKIGNSLAFSRGSRFDNNAGNRTFIHGAFTSLYQAIPTTPIYDPSTSTGYGGPTDLRLERTRNPLSQYELPTRENITDRLLGNVYLELTPLKGLVFRSAFSTDISNDRVYSYTPIWEEGLLNSGGLSNITQNRFNSFFWSLENTLTYSGSIGKHNFVATVGGSSQASEYNELRANASYDTDVFTEIVLGAVQDQTTSASSEESLTSLFGRLTYDYDNKYLLTAAVRRDGSSKFGPNNKFGVFPSFTLGWRVSQENFWNPDGTITDLKLRGGWGQVGSDAIGNFRYLARLNTQFDYAFGNETGVSSLGAALEDLANPNVKWETATEYNFGLDASFFNGKLTFTGEYYDRSRTDMLLVLPLAGVSGLNETVDNVGEVVNKGLEFSLGYQGGKDDFTYDFSANLSTINSEVVDLGGRDEIAAFSYSGSGATVVIRPGEPLGVFLGRRTEGLFQTQEEVDAANAIDGNPDTPYQNLGTGPGDFKWRDLDGDGRVTNDDKEIIGSPVPDFTYGFGGNFRYKAVDLSLQFFGVQGNDIFNIARSNIEASGRAFNKSSVVVNAWNGPGTSNSIPRPQVQDPNQNTILGDHLVEDGSYLRLRTLQVGFNVPSKPLSTVGMSNARIYISGQNVLTWTKFTGIDPEVGLDEGNSAVAGIYNDLYPQVQTWSVGLNVGF